MTNPDRDKYRLIASRPGQVTQACYQHLDMALLQGRELAMAGWYVQIQERPEPGRDPLEVTINVDSQP